VIPLTPGLPYDPTPSLPYDFPLRIVADVDRRVGQLWTVTLDLPCSNVSSHLAYPRVLLGIQAPKEGKIGKERKRKEEK
jgi:hypothetical protein